MARARKPRVGPARNAAVDKPAKVETLLSLRMPALKRAARGRTSASEVESPRGVAESPDYLLPLIGEVVGGSYRITGELGRGAMGVVFAAVDEKLRRPVAIKLIRAELSRPGFAERFQQEAQAMARVNHRNVVAIHAFGEYGKTPYFVMECVEGRTLERWLLDNLALSDPAGAKNATPSSGVQVIQSAGSGGALSSLRLRILHEICRGVAAIHAVGAVHRDIKPSNILLDHNLHCRVGDFGLSLLSDESLSPRVAGTLAYMAPELRNSRGGRRSFGPVCDVYSLGCVAYELLTGRHPFAQQARDRHGTLLPESEAPRPSSVRGDLVRALDAVLEEALSQDPERRTQTVEAFRLAIFKAQRAAPDRILIVESDARFRKGLCVALRARFPAAHIEAVEDGGVALAAAEREPASVAIIGVGSPGLDAVALTSALRTRTDTSLMPIIVVSDTGGAADWRQLSRLGADRFLLRPISFDDLFSVIEHAIAERAIGIADPLEASPGG